MCNFCIRSLGRPFRRTPIRLTELEIGLGIAQWANCGDNSKNLKKLFLMQLSSENESCRARSAKVGEVVGASRLGRYVKVT